MLATLTLSSCSVRLVDFTIISSKKVNLNIDKTYGKKVKAEKAYFLGLGWNIKDGIDLALDKVGLEYDLLVDGVVRYSSYPFVSVITVEGTAISYKRMRQDLGEAGFDKWLKGKNVSSKENISIASIEEN